VATQPVAEAVAEVGHAQRDAFEPLMFELDAERSGFELEKVEPSVRQRDPRPLTSAGVGMGLLAVSSRAPRRERPRIRKLPFFTSASLSFSPILPL
jgi:hypothetical protein